MKECSLIYSDTHTVIKTSRAHAKLSIKPTCKSVSIVHMMHMNDTMIEHTRALHADKTTSGASNQFISSHHNQLPQTMLKLSVVFRRGTEVTLSHRDVLGTYG